jgi:20S proteasome alpha/beta subunit
MGGSGGHTIEQPHREKVKVIERQVIVAGTGQVGLGQRFEQCVCECWGNSGFVGKNETDVACRLSHNSIKNFQQTCLQSFNFGALVAYPHKNQPTLIEFASGDFQPEIKNSSSWYVSMGAGQPVADPLLGLVRRVFWGDSPPDLRLGIFAAAMVLTLGCEMAPYGVSAPIQMAVLTKNRKKNLYARKVKPEELQEHIENVNGAIRYFGGYIDVLLSRNQASQDLPRGPG